jgi:hypothetical protein
VSLNDVDNLSQSMMEGVGALKAVVVSSPWQYGIYAGVFSSDNDPKNNGQKNAATNKLMGQDERGAALPDSRAKLKWIEVQNPMNNASIVIQVIDLGPHYTDDKYSDTGSRPKAEIRGDLYLRDKVKFKSYESDQNRAGIDLSPAAHMALGIPVKIVNTKLGPEWQTTGNDPKLNWRYIK